MIQAELKRKIPEVKNMEDILTSNFFGSLKYIEHKDVLLRILKQAKTLFGKSLLDSIDIDLSTYSPEFIFWENNKSYGEPDLIIKFTKTGEADLILCIEVKYFSSKSSNGDNDQLMRYYKGIESDAFLSGATFLGLIYLTKYPSRSEIEVSNRLIQENGSADSKDKLFQLKWAEITKAIEGQDKTHLSAVDRMILKDLTKYLHHKNLTNFLGFSFMSKSFKIKPERFYDFSHFRGFTFLHDDFNISKGEMFYQGDQV